VADAHIGNPQFQGVWKKPGDTVQVQSDSWSTTSKYYIPST
jgi:hypothetical protein